MDCYRNSLALTLTVIASLFALYSTVQAEVKIACVGDSITFGTGIKDRPNKSYPKQLEVMLGAGYAVKNFGVSGATLLKNGNKPYWKLNEFQAVHDYQPDIVVIKLGTNDTKPANWQHHAEFEADYIEMIRHFQSLASKPQVWICYPAPAFAVCWGINGAIVKDEVIPKIKSIAGQTGVPIIDLYAPLQDQAQLLPDQVHPNAAGAAIIAKTIHAAITAPSQLK